MHSFFSRANAVFAFTLSVLAGLTLCCFLSTTFNNYTTAVRIESTKHMVKNLPDYSAARERNDLGYMTLDLEADFSSLFNWNTKQLFLYLTAEYQTKNNVLNQVVLWDKIIQRGDRPVVQLSGSNMKYFFWDDGDGLRGNKNVTLTLSWNVIPNAGQLPLFLGEGSHVLSFPDEYTTSKF